MSTAAAMMVPVSKAALALKGGKKNGSITGTALNRQSRRSSRSNGSRVGAVQVRSDITWATQTSAVGYSNGAPASEVDPLAIVFVSAEVAPWSKTGGLGDVCGALPIELARRGHKVVTISPRYDQYSDAWDTSVVQDIQFGDCVEQVRYFHTVEKGVHRVWVDHPIFLARVWGKTKDKLYASSSALTYADNPKRFILLTKAALEANLILPFCPGEDCTFIANDWHTALLPAFLKHEYQSRGSYKSAKIAFCVHNIAFQGRFKPQQVAGLGVPSAAMDSLSFKDGIPEVYDESNPDPRLEDESIDVMAPDGKKFPKVNWMKSGFLLSDLNVTVSPNYAKELVSGPGKGAELDDVIRRSGGIVGIANGMDVTEWAPETDKFLEENYTKESVLEGKAVAKQSLQAEVGFDVDPSIPLIGYIGRLEPQKGVDIMLEALPQICQTMRVQVVILGTGKASFEEMVEDIEARFPSHARGIVKFSAPLAHMITAGADYLMVPSRFEPCGLIQLHAMQYGTVPMVSTTGGLVDTVKDGVTGIHMGAMDPDDVTPSDVSNVVSATSRAVDVFQSGQWTEMVRNCITQDLSWKEPAKKWEGIIANLKNPSAGAAAQSQAVRTPQENWTPGYTGPEKQAATMPKAWNTKPPNFAGSVLPTIALPPKVVTSTTSSTVPVSVGTTPAPAKLSTVRTAGSSPTGGPPPAARTAPGQSKAAPGGLKAVPVKGGPRPSTRRSGPIGGKTAGGDDDKPVQKEGPKPKRS